MKVSAPVRKKGQALAWSFLLIFAFIPAFLTAAEIPDNSTLLPIRRVAELPAIDGVLEECVRQAAVWSSPFLVLSRENAEINGQWEKAEEKFVKAAAKAAVFCDGKELYVVYVAPFPSDTPPGKGDAVEFFLQPEAGGKTRQVIADVSGNTQYFVYEDENAENAEWTDHHIRTAVKVNEDHFIVEMAIPLASVGIGAQPENGTGWRGNFCRTGVSCGGRSTWSPTGQRFFTPGLFGLLVNGSEKEYFGKEIRETAAKYPDLPEIGDRAAELLKNLEGVGRFSGSEAERQMRELAHLRRLAVKEQNKGKTTFLWQPDPWSDFGPDLAVTAEKEIRKIALRAPRGARAIGSFVVSNLTDRHNMFTIRFRGRKDILSRIRFREGGFVQDRKRTFPDAIFELPLGEVVRQAPESSSLIWVDLDTTGLAPGEYRGTIDFIPSYPGFRKRILAFELQVSEVDMAEVPITLWTYQLRHARALELLRDYGFNTSCLIAKWFAPDPDENGNYDFSHVDNEIEALERNGIPRREIRLLAYMFLPFWSKIRLPDGKTVSFGEPGWQEEYGKRLRLFRDHLKEKYGMDPSSYCFSLTDEPQGDPNTPGTRAWYAFEGAKFIKSVDPNFQTYTNPCRFGLETDALYPKSFDILVPYLPRMRQSESAMKLYEECGKKVYTYTIAEKTTRPGFYRRIAWTHMHHGFRGTPFFFCLFYAAGDQFMSGDTNGPESKVTADYGAAYINSRYKSFGFHQRPELIRIAVTRRLEAWYLGIIDFKISEYCRNRIAERKAAGEDTAAFEREFAVIAAEGASAAGDMDLARERLLDLAEKLLKK